jgi:hypothetical protein
MVTFRAVVLALCPLLFVANGEVVDGVVKNFHLSKLPDISPIILHTFLSSIVNNWLVQLETQYKLNDLQNSESSGAQKMWGNQLPSANCCSISNPQNWTPAVSKRRTLTANQRCVSCLSEANAERIKDSCSNSYLRIILICSSG